MLDLNRNRAIYFILILVLIGFGLSSRWFSDAFPIFLSSYLGDTLWASVLYLTLAFVRPSKSLKNIFTTTLIISFLIECSQLYQAEWISELRQIKILALMIGSGFLWTDLLCYFAGALFAVLVDSMIRKNL